MKPLHPTQITAIKIIQQLMEDDVPAAQGMGALCTALVFIAKTNGMNKAEILNRVGNTIDLVEEQE
jgi:hypothetical protein